MSDHYGIIGYPLSYSFSPGFFNDKFCREGIDAVYQAYPLSDIQQLKELIAAGPQLKGLNVTIPYKQAVMPLLDEIDLAAQKVGAVNCIAIRDGKTIGYNTDIIGFGHSLRPLLQQWQDRALILGAGGAAQAVAYVLKQLGILYKFVSRNEAANSITYDQLTPEIVARHKLIVNTTPLGMYPNIDAAPPIPYEGIGPQHLAYDLIYNPSETQFMKQAAAQGAVTKNGLDMLHLQALAGWEIWNKRN